MSHIGCSKEIESVPTTNVSPEWDFAILDRLLRDKPNATKVALESMMIYRANKTALWLQDKNPVDTRKLLKTARARVPDVKKMYKSREELIKSRQEETLIRMQREVTRREKKSLIIEKSLFTEWKNWVDYGNLQLKLRMDLKLSRIKQIRSRQLKCK